MKTCPHCGSHAIVLFDANNDMCTDCKECFGTLEDRSMPNTDIIDALLVYMTMKESIVMSYNGIETIDIEEAQDKLVKCFGNYEQNPIVHALASLKGAKNITLSNYEWLERLNL